MISYNDLTEIQDKLMECMTLLYLGYKDDPEAHSLAHALVHIYDDIEFNLILGESNVSDAGM